MISTDVGALFESGCSLIVGTVDREGRPEATRGWGAVVQDDEVRLRLFVERAAALTLENLVDPGVIAVTATDVPTFESVQVKGRVLEIVPTTEADHSCSVRHFEAFTAAIHSSDGTPFELLERIRPGDLVGLVVEILEVFDQTPGPGAGRSLARAES